MTWLINILVGLLTKSWPRRPPGKYDVLSLKQLIWVLDYRDLDNPYINFKFKDIDENMLMHRIYPILEYINKRYDCSDFRVMQILKLKFIAQDLLDKYKDIDNSIKKTLLGFKFWLTSPGYDSMCYYTENHQLCFIACEYLIGKMYPNEVFTNDKKTGLEHQKLALERFNYWMQLRAKYSYSEFYSSNYIPITLTALSFLYQYSNNEEIKSKCRKEINTLIRFFASTSFEDTFINASGRDYSRNVMNCSYNEPHSKTIINLLFGDQKFALYNYNSTESILVSCYLKNKELQISDEIKKMYLEKETITKRKFSLNLSEYKNEGLLNNDTKSLMMRLGSGALTNPKIMDLTIKLLKDNPQLYKNNFMCWLRFYYSPLLYKFSLMSKLSKKMNFYNNRMAIEESNVYTYRNKYFKMSTNQGYQMNSLGAQKNTMIVTLPGGITVYTMHPIVENNLKKFDYNSTPSYFSCYNFAPFAVQEKNVCLMIYNIPKRSHSFLYNNKLFGYKVIKYTHTFFPTELFDEYEVDGRFAFVRVKDTYLAITSKNNLFLRNNSEYVMKTTQGMLKDINKSFDLVQPGLNSYWIYELSTSRNETYKEFKERIKNNKIVFDHLSLEYYSKHEYKVMNAKDFYFDNVNVKIKYNYDLR